MKPREEKSTQLQNFSIHKNISKNLSVYILGYLNLYELLDFSFTSRSARQTLKDDRIWRERLRLHFPYVSCNLEAGQYQIDYINLFKEAYQSQKQLIQPGFMRFLCYIKEGDLASFVKASPDANPLSLSYNKQDFNRGNLLVWANKCKRKEFLNYHFSRMPLAEFKKHPNLLKVAYDQFYVEDVISAVTQGNADPEYLLIYSACYGNLAVINEVLKLNNLNVNVLCEAGWMWGHAFIWRSFVGSR